MKILQIFIFFTSSIGFCCSCVDLTGMPVLEHINKTEQIFEGIITEINSSDDFNFEVEFIITRKIKGINSSNRIRIQTSKSSTSCGVYFEKGQKWLIFSNSNSTSICDGNIELGNKTLNEFLNSEIPKQHKFYYSKLKDYLNKISELKTAFNFVEYDKENNLIAKGKIGKDKQSIGIWLYKDVPTKEIIVKIKN